MDLTAAYEIVGMAGTVASIAYARRAAKLSKPTGNGFAGVVLAKFDRLDARMDRMENRLDSLEPR